MTGHDVRVWVAREHGMRPEALLMQPRGVEGRPGKLIRYEAMALVRYELGWSHKRIGRDFGGFNHTTVMYGIKQIPPERLAELRARMAADFAAVRIQRTAAQKLAVQRLAERAAQPQRLIEEVAALRAELRALRMEIASERGAGRKEDAA